ncbi:MAG: DUF89 family protein [Oscillospiraceae bacterium]|nr:DUF89 family protein [Oscillospiraceae bacterium]
MRIDSYCIACQIERQAQVARELLKPEDRYRYLLDVMDAICRMPKDVSMPWTTPVFQDLRAKYGVTGDIYAEEKKWANDLVLPLLPRLWETVRSSGDPLLAALKFAQAGNFLDFAILRKDDVDAGIEKTIREAQDAALDETEYWHFADDLAEAKQLLILGDNAGEIAFDTLAVRQIQRQFPALRVVYGVRGGYALNDATREDSAYVGMDKLVTVIDNGSSISATELSLLGSEMRREIEKSDVILAKGQANFESLAGCGLNVYYNFLCKCERFCRILHVLPLTGMFLCDRRLPELETYPD